MSRIGKMPVAVPAGVDVSIKPDQIHVKGTGGQLALAQNALVKVSNEGGKLTFVPADASREANAMSGKPQGRSKTIMPGGGHCPPVVGYATRKQWEARCRASNLQYGSCNQGCANYGYGYQNNF